MIDEKPLSEAEMENLLNMAREAYLARYCSRRELVMSGKMDWNPWIKGYVAALKATGGHRKG